MDQIVELKKLAGKTVKQARAFNNTERELSVEIEFEDGDVFTVNAFCVPIMDMILFKETNKYSVAPIVFEKKFVAKE